MKLKKWKQRVKQIREQNKRTRVYHRVVTYYRLNLPTRLLVEGEVPWWTKLEGKIDEYNFYKEHLRQVDF